MSECRFRVLGPLEVSNDGSLLDLGSPRQRMVLAVLLASPNRVVSTDRLVDEIWGETPSSGVVHSLQTYLSNLRRLFGEQGWEGSASRAGPLVTFSTSTPTRSTPSGSRCSSVRPDHSATTAQP